MFLILTLALLPLGVVALIASLQAIRTADQEKTALLRVATTQAARKLGAELASDQTALHLTVNTLASGTGDANLCARTSAFLSSRASAATHFAIYDRGGRLVCGGKDHDWTDSLPAARRFDGPAAELLSDKGPLLVRVPSVDGSLMALSFYSRAYLDEVADPPSALQNRHIILRQGMRVMDLVDSMPGPEDGSAKSVSAPLPSVPGIVLTIAVRNPPVTLARALALFLPLIMWFAAAAVGWVVVSRLLIRPLVQLRRAVAGYRPGEVMQPLRRIRTPAWEIADLGETFRAMSEDVATHEAEMAEGLARQRRLTREVHHRVKNNLQIIASLINLHSRSATTAEAADAYASIQRRVDALSVVHRNHYAELEDSRGVGIRALVSELCASLRATAPAGSAHLTVQIDSDQLYVSQDVAVPVAFLITELVEMAILNDPGSTVRISVHATGEPQRATLTVSSPAFRPSPVMHAFLEQRFGRILTGLSRQLRAPLDFDAAEGRYAIAITTS